MGAGLWGSRFRVDVQWETVGIWKGGLAEVAWFHRAGTG